MERGGPTTQSGIRYQNSISALYMGALIDCSDLPERERVVSVRVEAPENVDDIVVTYADGHKLFIQVKEHIQQNEAAWKELWIDFRKQFDQPSFQRKVDRLCITFGASRNEYFHLQEISQRAQAAVDLREFQGRLTKEQNAILERIGTILFANSSVNQIAIRANTSLNSEVIRVGEKREKKGRKKKEKVSYTNSNDERKYLLELFRHLTVTIQPLQLANESIRFLIPESNRTQNELFVRFRDRAGEEARIRGTFDAEGLLAELETDGILLKKEISIDELREIAYKSGAELKNNKNTFGSTGLHIVRAITGDIVEWIKSGPATERIGVILDSAGSGKTVVARDVLERLELENVPALTLKGDLLSGIANLEDLQERLDLPEKVERVLKHLAGDGTAVLLVDQIDALSLSLAHDLNALDVVLRLVARVRIQPNIKIIIACRTFDFKNDPKLSRIAVSKEFAIGLLSDEEIGTVLKQFDLEFTTLQFSLKTFFEPLYILISLRALRRMLKHPKGRRCVPAFVDSIACKNFMPRSGISLS